MPGKENADAFSRWEEQRAFSQIAPVDKADFDKLDKRLKFAEWIEDPKKEQLGRAIAFHYPPDPDDEDEREKKQIIGRIFPLAEDNSKHLIAFKNRRMIIVEPFSPAEDTEKSKQERLKNHKSVFAFKPASLIFRMEDPEEDMDEQIGNVIEWFSEDAVITKTNDPYDELPTFNTNYTINKAIAVSKRLKERREQKFNRDMVFMMNAYEKQFGKVIFPPKDQPPHEQPPAAEPPVA